MPLPGGCFLQSRARWLASPQLEQAMSGECRQMLMVSESGRVMPCSGAVVPTSR